MRRQGAPPLDLPHADRAEVQALTRRDEGIPEVLVDRLLGDAEGAPDPYRLQFPGVNQPVDRHLGHSHDRGDFRHGQEPYVTQGSLISRHRWPSSTQCWLRLAVNGASVTSVPSVSPA